MKDFFLKNKYLILTISILTIIMFVFINQKQGYHEDEIFSYGSSNYKYDNVFRWYGYADAENDVLYTKILKGNFIDKITNYFKFINNKDSYKKNEVLLKETPIFRTKEEALEYLTINKEDIFNYFSVYYNQSRDVHPPLFYFIVHLVSTIFYNTFTKYIIFIINLVFFILSLLVINKIMKILDKDNLSIPTIILYGCSIGCISTVMFQRMYMMLTFFSLVYLYLIFKLIKDNFEINKKRYFIITILLGFLTQYYFVLYIFIIFILISIYLFIKKQFKKFLKYLLVHIIPAILGLLIYPYAIEDIFFSYRGIGSSDIKNNIFSNIKYYFEQIYKLFGLQNILIIITILLVITISYKIIKKNIKIDKNKLFNLSILIIPIFIYILIISKIAPFLGESYTYRYIMSLFPIISISVIYLLSLIYKRSNLITIILSIILSINGLINVTPTYLYKDNKKVLELANKYKNDYFVYVYDNSFTHLSSLPEFIIYKESIILNNNGHDFNVLNNDKLNNSNEFILCIKNWVNQDEVLNKVLSNTNYTKYEKLLYLNSDVEATYYKVIK